MSVEETTIIGVDYSGAIDEKKTWLTEGRLIGNTLQIQRCEPITRSRLTRKLIQLNQPAVVAMDFPFGVPKSFAKCWRASGRDISDLWESAAKVPDLESFRNRCKDWTGKLGKNPMRICDKLFPGSGVLSALCTAPRNMVPMTYYGMRMLHELNQAETGFLVPLQSNQEKSCINHPILLEVMPGAMLQSLQLYRPYKSADSPQKAQLCRQNRQYILDNLSTRSGFWLNGIRPFRSYALHFDDCLDSIVAAVTAAIWHHRPLEFRHPDHKQISTARVEGWIFNPKPLPK